MKCLSSSVSFSQCPMSLLRSTSSAVQCTSENQRCLPQEGCYPGHKSPATAWTYTTRQLSECNKFLYIKPDSERSTWPLEHAKRVLNYLLCYEVYLSS